MSHVTKTLVAKLVNPTAHKERKLRTLASTYRSALEESFDCHADTMVAVNDIVTPYDLPYQAKDALKSYVPKLFSKYEAKKLGESHPVRFVNRAATFDIQESRHHRVCWEVPQPGRGTNFWIPLEINPDQFELWKAIVSDTVNPGELRLHEHHDEWYLHVTVTFDKSPDFEEVDDLERTIIGVDIGESALLVATAVSEGKPCQPLLVSGKPTRKIRKEISTTYRRMQKSGLNESEIQINLTYHQNALTDEIEKASRDCVNYALGFSKPVIALEDLSFIRDRIELSRFMNRRLHSWAFSRLRRSIELKAHEAGIESVDVNPAYTSTICHSCGHIGYRRDQGSFSCTNDRCWVSTYQADINAAMNIAKRADPWGESCQLKLGDDDSPRDGRSSGGATSHSQATITRLGGPE